jgi:hypothetical protein
LLKPRSLPAPCTRLCRGSLPAPCTRLCRGSRQPRRPAQAFSLPWFRGWREPPPCPGAEAGESPRRALVPAGAAGVTAACAATPSLCSARRGGSSCRTGCCHKRPSTPSGSRWEAASLHVVDKSGAAPGHCTQAWPRHCSTALGAPPVCGCTAFLLGATTSISRTFLLRRPACPQAWVSGIDPLTPKVVEMVRCLWDNYSSSRGNGNWSGMVSARRWCCDAHAWRFAACLWMVPAGPPPWTLSRQLSPDPTRPFPGPARPH